MTESPTTAAATATSKFDPQDISAQPSTYNLPDELWTSILQTPCTFLPQHFQDVMLNLVKNPNLTSSYVFRAEIYYDSLTQTTPSLINGMKPEYRPRPLVDGWEAGGWEVQRTFVRRMIPRNPQLDKSLVQTCHFLHGISPSGAESNLVVMTPHVASVEEMPWYHPAAHSVGIVHTSSAQQAGTLSVHYRLFTSTPLDTRLERTALNLLKVVHKHAHGHATGYTKRVHHDLVIPQSRFQDTYTRLKSMYAKDLIRDWVEQTDPGKHVFEDLGIAAFLMELWRGMYGEGDFPGFVDVGCGNGVLVHVLRCEGWRGWGFDARRRKTWGTFPDDVRDNLKEMLLVPRLFAGDVRGGDAVGGCADAILDLQISGEKGQGHEGSSPAFHDGIFPQGTFIISNHADELTGWTPLLASLNNSPFIAIPCCSHNLSGARFRAPTPNSKSSKDVGSKMLVNGDDKTGQLIKRDAKQPSAYASLCSWIERLTADVGYEVEKEMLRIPSTRNACIVGRKTTEAEQGKTLDERMQDVRKIVEREIGDVEKAGREWVERAEKIAKSKGTCH